MTEEGIPVPSTPRWKRGLAATLVVATAGALSPAFAAPAPARASISGTVLGADAATPLVGATVVALDAAGTRERSSPTGADGAFVIPGVVPGPCALTLETQDGATYPIATPLVLAPGESRSVHVALKGKDDDKKKKKKGGAYVEDGGKGLGAMIAVLVGFVAAGAVAIDKSNDEAQQPASPSSPND